MAVAAAFNAQSRLPPIEADLPEEAPSRASFFKAYGRRILFVVVAIVLIFALLHLSSSSSRPKATESPPSASPADSSTPSPTPSFIASIAANPWLFSALFGVVAGLGGTVFYKIVGYVQSHYIAPHINFRPTLTITNLDPNFSVVLDYISQRCLSAMTQRAIEAETFKEQVLSAQKVRKSWYGISDEKTVPSRFVFRPAPTKYSSVSAVNSFIYRPYVPTLKDPKTGKFWDQSDPTARDMPLETRDEERVNPPPLWGKLLARCFCLGSGAHPKIDMTVDEVQSSNGGAGGGAKLPTKWLTLSLWGLDTTVLRQIVNDALLWHFETESQNSDLKIYVLSEQRWMEDWTFAVSKKKRSQESVVFDDDENGKNILRELIDDAKNFFSEQTMLTYADKGMPHRRGYLLYGPPGCGKTSFITVLAGELNKDVCILNLNDDVSDNNLASALRNAPLSAIIALEDVDAIFMSLDKDGQKTKDKRQMKSSKLSFSGLLNALDGVASQEGRILIMTTNHREKLDPALIRPGRVDVEKEIRNASRKQIENMFLRFYGAQPYPDALVQQAQNFAAKLPDYEISMAKLQGFFQAAAKRISNSAGEPIGFQVMPEKCIEKASELTKHGDDDPSMSVFEHFWRIGLERYAAHFERQCISNISQFRICDIDSVAASCVDLELDAVAVSTLKKLQKEDEELMSSSYAEADSSTIRDLFFAAFPSTDMQGNVTVYSRFNAVSRTRSAQNRCKSSEGTADSPVSCGDETPSAAGVFADSRSLLEVCSSVQHLIKSPASQKNTPLLFHTSIFRIKQLFQWYSNRPHSCETMLKNFAYKHEQIICQFSARQSCERLAEELDLPSFLKRLSVSPAIIPVLADMLIFDVRSFMEFCSGASVHVLCARFYLHAPCATRLLDFCSKDEKKNSQCRRKFSLPSKQDIRMFFIAHYTSSSVDLDESTLEQYSIEFAEKLCDPVRKCTSVVSYFEIEDYLVDKAPAFARSDEAIRELKSAVAEARTGSPLSPIFDHLFRVGLQHYAPAFVQCGATSVARFKSVDVESVCQACVLLALDVDAQAQLKLLQKEDEKYILAEFASASRTQVKNVLSGVVASDTVVSSLMGRNISLYLLRNITFALPSLEVEAVLFDQSISALFLPYSTLEFQPQPLSIMSILRRSGLPLESFHDFVDEFGSVPRFVKDAREGKIENLPPPLSQLVAFCSSKPAISSVARMKFLYPPTQDVAEAFLLFFTQSGSSMVLQDIKRHAFRFSRILSGCTSKGKCDLYPFRGRSYFSRNEIDAFLQEKFSSFAANKEQLTIETTVELCDTLFEFRRSEEFLREPAALEPPPVVKSDVRLWLDDIFSGDERTAEDVCKKLHKHALRKMADFDLVQDLNPAFLQTQANVMFGDACKVHAAFKALKAEQKK